MADTMDEIDEIEHDYFERHAASEQAMLAEGHPMVVQAIDGMPQQYAPDGQQYYPLSLAQGVLPGTMGPTGPAQPQPTPSGNLLTNSYAGLPGWSWGLIGIGVLGGGYWLYKNGKKVSSNDGEKEDDDRHALPSSSSSSEEPSSGWSPSRSTFAGHLKTFLGRKGLPMKDIKIYDDADEAKKYCKPCSPLITMKLSSSVTLPKAELEKLCKKDGLMVTDHGQGIVGLYPAPNGKRGRAWEKYVDLLRDDGQTGGF
jgi:hypothetical protein